MGLVVVGIDEAGYGPLLGPLCVGMAVLRVRDCEPGAGAPDLWKVLRKCVSRRPGDRRGRIAVADSKVLKQGPGTKSRHVLAHLERALLAFVHALGEIPDTDSALLGRLGADLEDAHWYSGDGVPLPVGLSAGEVAIAANLLRAGLTGAAVEVVDLRCVAVCEGRFNDIVRSTGTKAESTAAALGRHLRTARERWVGRGEAVEIACDRLGGRTRYSALLAREFGCPEASVRTVEESPERCRYSVDLEGTAVGVTFTPRAESEHLHVALASVVAKYTRELAMIRFNRYWCGRCPDLKPTAGYYGDARRWLDAVAGVATGEECRAMVRIL